MITPKPIKILYVAYLNSHLVNFFHLSANCKHQNWQVALVFVPTFERIQQQNLERCRREKVPVYNIAGTCIVDPYKPLPTNVKRIEQPPKLEKLAARVKNIPLAYSLAHCLFNVTEPLNYYRRLKRDIKSASNLIKQHEPDVVILPEENQQFQTAIFTKAAQKQLLPVLVLPYTIANATEAAEAFYNDKTHNQKGLNKIVTRFFPKWVHRYKDKNLTLLPWWQILALEKQGLAHPSPWVLNSGFADALAAESLKMFDYYKTSGLLSNKIVLTGALSDDVLAVNIEKAQDKLKQIRQKYNLSDRRIILVALPPNQLPRKECEFENYDQLIDFWLDAFSPDREWQIIFAPHPRLTTADIAKLKRKGVIIVDENVSELIPLCSLYVASISATIRWAIACGKPVLNYDVYQYGFHDYDSAPGVITINNKTEFIQKLHDLTQDKHYFQRTEAMQTKVMTDWGKLDGKSADRISNLIQNLIGTNKS